MTKCIVYPSEHGVFVTTPAHRVQEHRAAALECDEIDRAIADTQSRLTALGRPKSNAAAEDRAALEARLEDLQTRRVEATPKTDDEHIAEMSVQMYPGGGYVIVDKADLPASGESTTDWTIVDGKVVLK
jgi:predicted methyltransferase